MKTHIQKWGHSLAVRLPKSFADELAFGVGSPAEIGLEDGAIVVKPDCDRTFDLEALLAGVTDENIHPAWETEPPPDGGEPGGERGRPGGDGGR